MGRLRFWRPAFLANRTGDAITGDGGFANTGVITVVNAAERPPARSAYLHQVRQIFPWELIGREEELAELTTFCTAADGPPYVHWQGPAWAGKSALMAWFVQHPPPGVRLVSFFVTARYASQSDAAAFLSVVTEQLAEVAGQPMPDLMTDSNRQAHQTPFIAGTYRLTAHRVPAAQPISRPCPAQCPGRAEEFLTWPAGSGLTGPRRWCSSAQPVKAAL
ncbi:hypothetical protein ACIBI9_49085 [Nonomuraea sp. NPDC050451]|uniref:hypothetical protein n=1 Tax=Nonomuraea sp. NPDC050451 TaxID=3364364 RepID=UPI0037A43FC5